MRKPELVFLALMWAIAACAPLPKIGYDFDRSVDFSAYRTYAWLSGDQEKTGDRRADSSAVDMRVRIAVGTQLRLKGYQAVPEGKPDFYVAYHEGADSGRGERPYRSRPLWRAGVPTAYWPIPRQGRCNTADAYAKENRLEQFSWDKERKLRTDHEYVIGILTLQ